MQEENKTVEKKKKVGADGLTKAERRALKIGGAQKDVTACVNNKVEKCAQDLSKLNLVQGEPVKPPIVVKQQTPDKQDEGLGKAELKAKRRAIQEAQRLAKTQAPAAKATVVKTKSIEIKSKPEEVKKPKDSPKKVVKKQESFVASSTLRKVQLFNHLYFEDVTACQKENLNINSKVVHPAFIKLGAQYGAKTIIGCNSRCLALLSALKILVQDYRTPPKQELCRSLESVVQNCTKYLQQIRPLAVSMINALRHFKLHLTQMDTSITDGEKKHKLLEGIDSYIRDEIDTADQAISITVQKKISDGDVILTFGCSSLVRKILLDAHANGKSFHVIVVDGRPLLEGREMLRKLVVAGLQCSYVLINAVSYIMGRATKVILGAHALLANGSVMSRTGTAQVAMIAHTYNKPVLVCCETYKFCERAQTDSFVYNEIDDPDKLVSIDTLEKESPLVNWKNMKTLTPLNLMYDVTPPDLVTAVVTELAILPCTSVPVILRIKPTEVA